MKRILTLLVLFFLAWQSFGQIREKNIKKERYDFQHKIDSLIYFIQQYDTLTPFSDRAELIDSLNNEITSRLLFVLNDKSVLNYQIESLFKEHLIFVSKSADKKIYLLSFDEKTGGSNRTNTTIIHYRPANWTVKAAYFGDNRFGNIFQLDSTLQKYFAIGEIQTCNSCCAFVALVLQLNADSIQTEAIANYEGRFHNLKAFDYNLKLKEFYYEFTDEDISEPAQVEDNKSLNNLRFRHTKKLKYLHDNFVEVESCDFIDLKE